MSSKKVPLRKCVVTQEKKPKKEMVRIVRGPEAVEIDPTGKKNGRGAYISLDLDIAKRARETGVLNQALNAKVDDDFYDKLIDYIDYQLARQELLKENES